MLASDNRTRGIENLPSSVFSLADEIDQGLREVRPSLSPGQLEQINGVFVSSTCVATSVFDPAPTFDDSVLQDNCATLLARLDSHPSTAWATFVVRALGLLTAKAGLPSGPYVAHVWRIALQAEEKHGGLGRTVMRACIDSVLSRATVTEGALGMLASGNLLVLMDCVIAALRLNGHPPPLSQSPLPLSPRFAGVAEAGGLPSQAGLRLVFDVASHILEVLARVSFQSENDRGTPGEAQLEGLLEAWRWDLHVEVVRLLRACRLEEVRQHLILTIARPLYHGWGHVGALEDLWSFLASADKESVELRLALLCIVGKDLIKFLALPARHSQAFWDLVHLAISNQSDLCRRRGLHMLQQVLAFADESVSNIEGEELKETPNRRSPRALQLAGGEMFSTAGMFARDALLEWKDYVRVLEMLEMETEMHLLDQVVPTVERLCSKLSPATSYADAPPMATEFRWVAIPLSALITTGTVARRRNFIFRIVTRDLGLGKRVCGLSAADSDTGDGHALSHMEEVWVAQVLLPALDQVGWHSSTTRASLRDFSRSVTEFLRIYVGALPVPRVTTFLTLILTAVSKRWIGSTGVLCAVLAAFDLGGTKMPAMGARVLFQIKEMLVTVLPPLNQAKRVLLLDGVVQILEAFTDYEGVALASPLPSGGFTSARNTDVDHSNPSIPSLGVVLAILSAIPVDLAKHRYLTRLATWVAGLLQRGDTLSVKSPDDHTLWLGMYRELIAVYLQGRVGHLADGRNLCLLGLLLSEGFALEDDRDQMLATGLVPLLKILRQCWHEPYVAAKTVQAALVLFSAWAVVSDAHEEVRGWRWKPLEGCVEEVVTFVTARLESSIEAASKGTFAVEGGDAKILLGALSAAINCVDAAPLNTADGCEVRAPAFHAGAVALRDRCASLLTDGGQSPLPPTAHLLGIASLEIVVRAQGKMTSPKSGRNGNQDEPGCISRCFSLATAEAVVRSLLHNNVEGRVVSQDGSIGRGSDSEWDGVLKEHERRKWSCLSELLPVVLSEAAKMNGMAGELSLSMCDALVEGIRASLREEMPMAMACFRTVFPCFMRSLRPDERAVEFSRVFQLVWVAFKEVRRPQLPLVRYLISGVLDPVHLAMPELNGDLTVPDEEQGLFLVDAFNSILEFGAANKPNVLRALVGRLTVLWMQSPGSMLNLVPGMVELLLFKEWGQGIETISNEASSAAEAPRLMLLLFIESWLIPSAANGSKDSRHILRALTLGLMETHTSKEFRQSSITDPIIYGRKLRAWQALCVLCGYICGTTSAGGNDHISEVAEAVEAWFWPVHGRTALPPVRQHMEVFAVRMCKALPDLFIPSAIKQLSDVRLPGQVLCSLLTVAGHLLVGNDPIVSSRHRLDFFEACLPWMVGTHVMGRMIAQLICHSLLPEVGVEGTHLEALFFFVRDNPDMVKMRQRQFAAFMQADCMAMCTVKGMLKAHGTGSNGEISPVHLTTLLQEAMDEIWNEASHDKNRTLEEGRAWLQTAAEVKKGTWFEEDETTLPDVDNHIQQKIIPWDKLDLAADMASYGSLERSTAAGRLRQSVVMCATLVDKVPNLAGLARTCEIFAASSLVVPDLRVMKNPAFSKISTGAEQWLPIQELGEKQLLAWIRRVKRQGCTLVGVEQTNNSVCLTEMKFPRRSVLVLGREHSGLPLAVINEMDFCCQIPQQGVLRSLNAHVSGALVLWEYTRQMLTSTP